MAKTEMIKQKCKGCGRNHYSKKGSVCHEDNLCGRCDAKRR